MTPEEKPHDEDALPCYVTLADQPTFSGFSGITMQAIAGAKVMVNRVVIPPGAVVPEHQHPHEQAGYVLEGVLYLVVEGETWELPPGAAYVLPGDTRHSASCGPKGCVVLDVFGPPRQDYLERLTT